jgi:hypothetical protein
MSQVATNSSALKRRKWARSSGQSMRSGYAICCFLPDLPDGFSDSAANPKHCSYRIRVAVIRPGKKIINQLLVLSLRIDQEATRQPHYLLCPIFLRRCRGLSLPRCEERSDCYSHRSHARNRTNVAVRVLSRCLLLWWRRSNLRKFSCEPSGHLLGLVIEGALPTTIGDLALSNDVESLGNSLEREARVVVDWIAVIWSGRGYVRHPIPRDL